MKPASNEPFRLGVLAANAGHHPASRRLINNIRHETTYRCKRETPAFLRGTDSTSYAASSDFCFARSGSMMFRIRGFITLATSFMTGMTTLLPNCL